MTRPRMNAAPSEGTPWLTPHGTTGRRSSTDPRFQDLHRKKDAVPLGNDGLSVVLFLLPVATAYSRISSDQVFGPRQFGICSRLRNSRCVGDRFIYARSANTNSTRWPQLSSATSRKKSEAAHELTPYALAGGAVACSPWPPALAQGAVADKWRCLRSSCSA